MLIMLLGYFLTISWWHPGCSVPGLRDGPEGAVGQAHFLEDGLVVRPVQVAAQGVEGAVEEEFQVAQMPFVEADGRVVQGGLFEAFNAPEMDQEAF